MFDIELPLPPSQNQLLRMHWARRAKLKKEYTWLLCADKQRLAWIADNGHAKQYHVTITRRSCGREPDPKNLEEATKLILDALVESAIIPDANPHVITLGVYWEKASRKSQCAHVLVWRTIDVRS